MSSIWVKRIVLIVISLVLGLVITEIGVVLMGTTREEYGFAFTDITAAGLAYYPLTVLFAALGVAIWLDKFLDTKILPH